ncbi:saccharopine dehydrogenase NADP-binding domain-containing protein [Flavihumibacter rivuli]|uniref:saccharopine dehydrogenase family protein n=1 Tax=Flavihumibacter rivuli TaxID=2838156 RepID=UPI001BDE621D|nr:saccharopine dehydrogenase NADP-binding domain-containing protein [Flavihumibacter rivuli]ULQ55680.1 saccharopine dehydrogenase NADP-binding domain-containing protein [Flavihumibacter rivuli]
MAQILLYGANGYTGKLIIREAIKRGMSPILAGRNPSALQQLAQEFSLTYRVASLEDKAQLDSLLSDISVVIHAAGPFSITARPMIEACIRNKVHYLDITGEIPVFELAKKYDQQAKDAGIMVMPGVGFDVVPTDCMASHLKEQLPDATHLELGFASVGGAISHGTATTMAMAIGEGGAARENGRIVPKPLGFTTRKVDLGKGPWLFMSIPWGDVSTAFHTTGIPNITTFTSITPGVYRFIKLQGLFNWLLRTKWARKLIQKKIDGRPAGPTDEERSKSYSLVWGKVYNAKGEAKEARLRCENGYTLTAISSLVIAQKVIDAKFCPGYQTPAGCYGSNLVLEIEGSAFL